MTSPLHYKRELHNQMLDFRDDRTEQEDPVHIRYQLGIRISAISQNYKIDEQVLLSCFIALIVSNSFHG